MLSRYLIAERQNVSVDRPVFTIAFVQLELAALKPDSQTDTLFVSTPGMNKITSADYGLLLYHLRRYYEPHFRRDSLKCAVISVPT